MSALAHHEYLTVLAAVRRLLLPPRRRKLIESEESFFASVRRAMDDRKEGRGFKPTTWTSYQSLAAAFAAIARKLLR